MLHQESLFYWNGPQTRRLVERFKSIYPFEHVMPCSSGTASIHIALATAQIGYGDEVITTPITDMGSLIGILYQQAVPVFADIDKRTYNLCPRAVEAAITPRTKAILAVHLSGNACDLAALREIADKHNLVLIEDCAQAWGARWRNRPVGTLGHFGCYSLNDFKHISCGDGGLVGSSDATYGPLLQKYGDKGYDRSGGPRMPEILGLNYRISEPQSAVGAAQLAQVEAITSRQNRLGTLLTSLIQDVPAVIPHYVPDDNFSTYWFYILRVDPSRLSCSRDEFVVALQAEGVGCGPGYLRVPVYQYPVFQNHCFVGGRWPLRDQGGTTMDYRNVHCPDAEAMLRECLTIPISQACDEAYISSTARAIRKVVGYFRI